MKGIVKKLISTIAAAAVALTVMILPAAPGSVAEAAMTENCTGNHSGMTAWTGGALSSGSYYLNGNVDLTDQITIGNGTDVTLCLNGHTITAASGKRLFEVTQGGALNLCDCKGGGKLTGGAADNGGGAIYINNGTFYMYGGEISGNTASGNAGNGGAVCLAQRGKFYMVGGTISNNTADHQGGAVYLSARCEFTMRGGTIEKNKASFNGGGVCVGGSGGADGTFKMNGGTISGNETTADGGGVFVSSYGAFTMSGGTISGNKARTDGGGVCFYAGKFTIDGKVDISGNTKTGDSSANNVYLYRNKTITIESGFDTDNSIGVNTDTAPTCKAPVAVTGSASDISSSFKADIAGQSVVYNSGQVQLLGAHNWGEWQTTKEPTTTEAGEKTRTCKNSDEHIETVELPKKGGGSSGSSSGGSSNRGSSSSSGSSTDNLTGDTQKENGNPSTGTTTAILPTALIAAAAMLISSKRRCKK